MSKRQQLENPQADSTLQPLPLCQIGNTGVQSIICNNAISKELNLSWKDKGMTIIYRKLTTDIIIKQYKITFK